MSAESNVVSLPKRLPTYGDAHVLAGEYDAVLSGVETWARCHGWAPRCVLVFTIADADHLGVSIPGYYRVLRLFGKPRRNGQFKIGARSRLHRDLTRMIGYRSQPLDRVPVECMNKLYRIVVRDVTKDQDEHPLGAGIYSVLDWVKGEA
jgi:hypothetical protein